MKNQVCHCPQFHSGKCTKETATDIPKWNIKGLAKKMKKKIEEMKWKVSTQYYRDMHSSPFNEAICPHGIGHHKGIHGCDGCCATAPKEIWDKVSKD